MADVAPETTFTAFAGDRQLASGSAARVAAAAAEAQAAGLPRVVILDDGTGKQVELDLRGPNPMLAGHGLDQPGSGPAPSPARGRPKLGVSAREVTLLPRHWEWLAQQPGGASATLRRLVEEARRAQPSRREAQNAVYSAMSLLAGDLPGYEEASRALFAGDLAELTRSVGAWPTDVSRYLSELIERSRLQASGKPSA